MPDRPHSAQADKQNKLAFVAAVVVAILVANQVLTIGLLIKLLIAASIIRAIISVFTGEDKNKAEQAARPVETQAQAQPRESLERLVLRVASANDGYVTPEALVMAGDGLTLKTARELLDDLAVSGSCEVDADDDGHMTYRFRTNVGPVRDAASPEQWVAQHAGRMTGESSSADQEVDA